jgi:uncharacterized protein (DUF302 family)
LSSKSEEVVMQTAHKDYAIVRETDLPFTEAVNRTRDLLQAAGYGVLCEIDVKAKLEEKLGVEREPYVILGACNPPLASEALDVEPELGVLLPCNVAIYEREGRTRVAAVEPERMLSIVGNEKLGQIATKVREDLDRVVKEIAKG